MRLTGRDLEGMVTREAYIALHLRVGKALQSEFDVKASENNANMDWAEDITAFSGEGARGCPPIRLFCQIVAGTDRVCVVAWCWQMRRVSGWRRSKRSCWTLRARLCWSSE